MSLLLAAAALLGANGPMNEAG
jgi:hypothetical protein